MDQTIETRGARRRSRSDRGSSLTEVVIAIALLGFAVSSVIAGIRMTIAVSTTSDDQAKVEAVLTSASDRLANWAYRPCPGTDAADYLPIVGAAAAAVGWDDTAVSIDGIEFWDPSLGATGDDVIDADGNWSATNSLAGADCNEDINLTTSRTLQKVTIRVTAPSGGITRTIEVVKSNIVADPTETSTP